MMHLFRTFLITLVAFAAGQLTYGVSVTSTIQTDSNDAEEHLNSQAFSPQSEVQGDMESLTSSDLETSEQESGLDWQALGVQWSSLGIPQGAPITSATVTFQIDAANIEDPPVVGESTAFTVYADAADNSATFSATPFDITSRTRSAALVAWDASTVPDPEIVGSTVTIGVTSLVQDVVNRPGWSPNNQLSIMVFPDVYLANPGGAPLPIRVLEFEAGPGLDSATLRVNYVPEPASLALLAMAGLCLPWCRRTT